MKRKFFSLATVVVLLTFLLSGCFRSNVGTGPVSLTFYGLDNSDVFDPIISKYKDQHSNVNIKYKKFNDPVAFEDLLVNEIAQGEGPDIFYINNTWLPHHIKKVVPLQSTVLTPTNFSETFVNIANQDFVQPDPADGIKKIYALPLFVDTLALYYNKGYFERKLPERGKPGSTWDIIKEDASKLREQGQDGVLQKGGIALGRGDNISLAADIFYNLLLQGGVDFYDKDFKQVAMTNGGQEYFDYLTSFSNKQNKNYSWSENMVTSDKPLQEVEAFLSGKVGAIAAYSDLYGRITTEGKNVAKRAGSVIDINDVGVMKMPQVSADEADFKVLANYYGLAVSRNSKNAQTAWDFVQFATSKSNSTVFHQKTKKPTARRDLIEEQKKEPITDVFVSQVGYADSFRLFSKQRFDELIKQAFIDANGGQNARQALGDAQNKMNELIKLEAPNGLYPKPKKK